MKKQVLLIALVLLGLTSAKTTATITVDKDGDLYNSSRYRYAEPILFVERGVEFLIFHDGSFDFNTDFENTTRGNDYYRKINTRRSSVNATFGAPGTARVHFSNPRSNGVLIQHDNDGKVRRIGNVFINYDREGRVKRVGSVYMSYQRGNGLLKQVGGLKLNYNRWGEIIHYTGVVNYGNSLANINLTNGNGNSYGYNDLNYYADNDDFYYYRKGNQVKKQKKIKRK